MIIKEFCLDSLMHLEKAISLGIKRVELCDHLQVGGTTPSSDTMKECRRICEPNNVKILSMLRPRGGNFVYTDAEKEQMFDSLKTIIDNQMDGAVIGAITNDFRVDTDFIKELVKLNNDENFEFVFHMAFDVILRKSMDKAKVAIDELVKLGFSRILTHGGNSENIIFENVGNLKELISYSGGRITIMPGGSVNFSNYEELHKILGINEFHGQRIVKI